MAKTKPKKPKKNIAAQLIGSMGGAARARKLTAAQRSEIARKAGLAGGRGRGKEREKSKTR